MAFFDTGAYQEASASNFNAMPRPAVALVRDDEASLCRAAESVESVLGRDCLPAHLSGRAPSHAAADIPPHVLPYAPASTEQPA